MQKVLLIDRDGTLIEEPVDFQVDKLAKIRLCPHVIPSLLRLQQAGFELVMVSNQDGLGTETFPRADFELCHNFILQLFSSQGIYFKDILICPHTPDYNCFCRKPKTGLLTDYLQPKPLNKSQSWMIGDRNTDKQFAENLDIRFLPINDNHSWLDVANTILQSKRSATVRRRTNETNIALSLVLDTSDACQIKTPIGFFSHMLEQIARHGGFSLQLEAEGDTIVDEHHLIEDVAIALGEALRNALGNKWGIGRYGFTLPMDESIATVAIDLCGRSSCVFSAPFTREFVGGMATEMVPHFFNSLAQSLGASLHITVTGENHHHMIEACFKGLGRALRQACQLTNEGLPSTKGVL